MIRHLTLVGVVMLALVATPVAAQSDQGFIGDLIEDGDQGQDGIAADIAIEVAEIGGEIARTSAALGLGDEASDATASEYASEATTAFNDHNETLQAVANANVDATTDNDVFAVYFHDRDGGNVTRYIVADVVDGEYESVRMVTPTEFNDTNRTQDHYVSLDWYASGNAAAEIDAFAEAHQTDANVSRSEAAALYGEYGSGVESDLLK